MPGRGLRLEERAFIPIDTDPGHGGLDAFDPLRSISLGVSVFDSQYENAAALASEDPIVERRLGPAYVEVASGRRGEADTNRAVRHPATLPTLAYCPAY